MQGEKSSTFYVQGLDLGPLCVLLWNQGEQLPSMEFITSKELEESRYAAVKNVLEEYGLGKEFLVSMADKISYDRVIDRLCLSDKKN